MNEKKINPLNIILIVLSAILFILVVLLSVVCIKLFADKTKAVSQANEYKKEYDELVLAQQEKEQSVAEYQNRYNKLVADMLNSGASVETQGNIIVQVWNNAIFQKDDASTDKYTKVNGKFVSDFNDALGNLFRDPEFTKEMSQIVSDRDQIKLDMKEMTNPPDGYEEAYQNLKEFYEEYLAFSDIVINCNGSLESFSNSFNEADSELIKKYNSAELYVK